MIRLVGGFLGLAVLVTAFPASTAHAQPPVPFGGSQAAPEATPTRVAPPGSPGYAPPPGYPYGPGYAPYYPMPYGLLPPASLPYEDGQSVPHGYRVRQRPMRSLLIAGSVTFGVSYLTSVLFGAGFIAQGASENKQYAPLFAPVIGPFIAMGTVGSGAGTPVLVLDGLAQLGGMAMLICGAAIDEKFLERTVASGAGGAGSALERFMHPVVVATPKSFGLRWTVQ